MRVIKFGATWCGACTMLQGLFDKNGLDVESLDLDENTELATRYDIRSLPTTLILDDSGTVVEKFIGAQLKPEQLEKIRAIVG